MAGGEDKVGEEVAGSEVLNREGDCGGDEDELLLLVLVLVPRKGGSRITPGRRRGWRRSRTGGGWGGGERSGSGGSGRRSRWFGFLAAVASAGSDFESSSFGSLVFVAQDEVELVFVSWTFPSCFGALVARWLGFVALDGSQYHITLCLWSCRLQYTLIRRVRHIWQPLEGFPQYTIFDTLAVGCWKDGGGDDSDFQ